MSKGREIIKKCQKYQMDELYIWEKAIKIANLDENGFGYLDVINLPEGLRTTNGKTWSRTAEKYFKIVKKREGKSSKGKVLAYQFNGFCDDKQDEHVIPIEIKKHFLRNVERNCPVLGTSINLEIDHKYSYNFYNSDDFKNNPSNYQYLSSNANSKKREEEARRKESGRKYDNRKNGCIFATTLGTLKYEKEKITVENPYDGQFFTDVIETRKRDLILYRQYYSIFEQNVEKINDKIFMNIYIPLINEVIDYIDIENIIDVFNKTIYLLENNQTKFHGDKNMSVPQKVKNIQNNKKKYAQRKNNILSGFNPFVVFNENN